MMTLIRRLAFLGLCMIAAVPSGWAQIGSPVALENGQALSYDGLTFTISGCAWATNSTTGSGGACSSVSGGVTTNLNSLVLEGVQTGRDQITIEVANSTATSAALSQSLNGRESYLNFTVTVSETPGYTTTQASGALLTAVGVDSWKTSGTNSCSTCSATFTTTAASTPFHTTPLSPAAAFANSGGTTTTVQTRSSAQDALSSDSSSFSVTENLSITTSGTDNTSTLKLNTVALKFYTTPEPASVALLLVGFSGLMMARRRRRAS